MKKAFTLVELMVVVGIMGLMGTISVGGYRAMRQGMEERGVMQNVNQFIRNAYQRAMIERVPTAIYFWNETRKNESDDSPLVVVGRAVAVRQVGRVTAYENSYLIDEFADFQHDASTNEDGDEVENASSDGLTFRLYRIDGDPTTFGYSQAKQMSVNLTEDVNAAAITAMMSDPTWIDDHSALEEEDKRITLYGYKIMGGSFTAWKAGYAYGREFADLTLPKNYIFGNDFSKNTSSPKREIDKICFSPEDPNDSAKVWVYALRSDSSGNATAVKVEQTVGPGEALEKQIKQ